MTSTQRQRALAAAVDCDVRFDNLTRQLYATDASIYQIEPLGVAFPRNGEEAAAVVRAATEQGMSIIPRGAGSGLVGGALGDGLVVDFSRHNRQIRHLDLERRTVRVGAGVVLDQLNAFLQPHGYCFGPDVATSSRATLGGMIANDSSGARAPFYGTTAEHVNSLELVLAGGRRAAIGPGEDGLPAQQERIRRLIETHAAEIAERMPPGLKKRWPGYGIERLRRQPDHLPPVLGGSEGTLAAIVSAELRIVPRPQTKGLGIVFFASVTEAMQATVELLELQPVAIEHVDRVLFDQTRGQLAFQAARDLLELAARPCESFLIVEFYEDVADRLAALEARRLGLRTTLVRDPAEMNLVWGLRKAGLSLLTGCAGAAKPVTGIEDAAVRPEQLPAYVAGLQSLLKRIEVSACFYGHAASGLLHVRPVLDLHQAGDVKKFRQICDDVSALVRQFNGSLSAEHGVGLARTEYLREQLGDTLLGVMREIKTAFDPDNVFNPGKIVPARGRAGEGVEAESAAATTARRYQIDSHLRLGDRPQLRLPFEPVLAFAAKDHSFVGNLEQCNGCGGCRKDTPTMCPTFRATGEEIMSTRGRANTIRAVLELRGLAGREALRSAELEAALSNCLSCKACTAECPSNVNLALLKAELLHGRFQRDGLPLRVRLISAVDWLGRWGCRMPGLANAALEWPAVRWLLEKTLGFSAKRTLPAYAAERFDHWFQQRPQPAKGSRGPVVLWDDTFVRYHEPHIGRAAVAVLEAAGFEVLLAEGRQCCGRPAFSQGNLGAVRQCGQHNLALLSGAVDGRTGDQPQRAANRGGVSGQALTDPRVPILFLEPSCWSMFKEDYRELNLPGAGPVAGRCILFEQFIEELLTREPDALPFQEQASALAIHAHCHAKSLLNPVFLARLAQRLPGRQVNLLDTGCCGMAGAFGVMASKYELSVQVARPLVEQIRAQPEGAIIVASGTSCRHQIEDLTPAHPLHMAEVLAAALPRRS